MTLLLQTDRFQCYKGHYTDAPVEFKLTRLDGSDLIKQLNDSRTDFRVAKDGRLPVWEMNRDKSEVRFAGVEFFPDVLRLFGGSNCLAISMSAVYRTKRQIRVILPRERVHQLIEQCSRMGLTYISTNQVERLLFNRTGGSSCQPQETPGSFRYSVNGHEVRRARAMQH